MRLHVEPWPVLACAVSWPASLTKVIEQEEVDTDIQHQESQNQAHFIDFVIWMRVGKEFKAS